MSIRSLKRMKRRLIPVIAIAAAIVPTAAQAQPMMDGGGSASTPTVVRPDDRGGRGLVYSQLAHRVSGLDQTRVIPGYNAPRQVVATRPDDRGTRGSFVDQIQQPAPVAVSAPSAGFNWGDASYGLLIGLVGALAIAAAVGGLRRQKQHAGLAY